METGDVLAVLAEAVRQMSGWEVVAVVLAVAYLVLAARENIWCWAAAFASTLIYIFLFFDVSLFLESALNVFYLVMAVYGWYQWRHLSGGEEDLHVSVWPLHVHLILVPVTFAFVFVTGFVFSKTTTAALPYVDAFTTWFGVVTTYMVTKKILENWLYWFVIDSVSIYLYINRGLYLTALLFVIYLVIIVFGYLKWKGEYEQTRFKDGV